MTRLLLDGAWQRHYLHQQPYEQSLCLFTDVCRQLTDESEIEMLCNVHTVVPCQVVWRLT